MTAKGTAHSDTPGVIAEDPVQLSREARVRMDVVRGTQETRPQPPGDEQLRSRDEARELFAKDMLVRAEDATESIDEQPLRGLPSYEVEVGKLGRAYAVERGVTLEPVARVEAELAPAEVEDVEEAEDAAPEPAPVAVTDGEQAEAPPDPSTTAPLEDAEPVESAPVLPDARRKAQAYRDALEPAFAAMGSFSDTS